MGTGHNITYKKPTDIVAFVLSQPDAAERFEHQWSYNDGVIEKPYHTDGWLEHVAYFYDHYSQQYVMLCTNLVFTLCRHLPLHYEIFWDGFEPKRQRKRKATGVYLRFPGDKKVSISDVYFMNRDFRS